jgi:ABC-type uncharacterized transport system involved in gliding motility auxiliary subunit
VKRFLSLLASFRILALILGLVSFFIAVLVQLFLQLTDSAIGLIILGSVLLLISLLGSLEQIRDFLIDKRSRYGLNSAIMIVMYIGIMLLANYLGAIGHLRIDLTASGRFTLSPQTVKVIKNLKSPVEALAFFPDVPQYRAERREAQYLLEEYRYFNRMFSFRFIDPETKPAMARRYRIRSDGTIVFVSGERQKSVTRIIELEFTGAILEVIGVRAKKIYFLSGHGERDVADSGKGGYSVVRMGLARDLYEVETLNLTRELVVPDDCAVLVIAGASKSFPAADSRAIGEYLRGYGKVLLLVDPDPPTGIRQILSDWGLTISRGHIVDRGAYAVPDQAAPAIYRGNYPPMIITRALDTTYFPDATSIDLSNELTRVLAARRKGGENEPAWPLATVQYNNLAILPALLTSGESWLETGYTTGGVKKNRGPLVLGALLVASAPMTGESPRKSSEDKLTRVVIIGDSDFASNSHIHNGGNGDLFLNSINWLAEEEHLINIRPKQQPFRKLLVSENASRFIRFSSVALLPLLILVLGITLWWRNR